MKHTSSKKEKGTINSTHDSVKNHLQFNKKDSIFKRNLLSLIDNLQSQITKNQIYLTDNTQLREHDQYLRKLKHIKLVATADPRFPYKVIQSIIDDLYRKSPVKPKQITIVIPIDQLINIENFNPSVYGI